jgi:hypothetical protein
MHGIASAWRISDFALPRDCSLLPDGRRQMNRGRQKVDDGRSIHQTRRGVDQLSDIRGHERAARLRQIGTQRGLE